MSEWLVANLGNIITLVIVALILAFAIYSMIKNKKKGKTPCGCGCSNCALKEGCHKEGKEDI